MKRVSVPAISAQLPFLNSLVPSEKYFCDVYGPECTRKQEETAVYYMFTPELEDQINTVTKTFHDAFMKATEKVIKSNRLMMDFGIPHTFWEPIRKSWSEHRAMTISGRFDLILDKTQTIKVLEYNADSAGALLETAVIQKKWAKSMHVIEGGDAGRKLELALISQWKSLRMLKGTVCHFMIDNDSEEKYNAAYMQEIASAAGLKSKLCVGLDDFVRDSSGNIFHVDGERVRFVWKMWSWNSVFNSYEKDLSKSTGARAQTLRLHDILLHPDISVMEPLWKIVTTNKMTMTQLGLENSQHVLRASDQPLLHQAFFKKPVAGRGGRGINFFEEGSSYTKKGESVQDSGYIYQEAANQKPLDGWFSTIGSWVVGSEPAGFGVREDTSSIITQDSPFRAARVGHSLSNVPKNTI